MSSPAGRPVRWQPPQDLLRWHHIPGHAPGQARTSCPHSPVHASFRLCLRPCSLCRGSSFPTDLLRLIRSRCCPCLCLQSSCAPKSLLELLCPCPCRAVATRRVRCRGSCLCVHLSVLQHSPPLSAPLDGRSGADPPGPERRALGSAWQQARRTRHVVPRLRCSTFPAGCCWLGTSSTIWLRGTQGQHPHGCHQVLPAARDGFMCACCLVWVPERHCSAAADVCGSLQRPQKRSPQMSSGSRSSCCGCSTRVLPSQLAAPAGFSVPNPRAVQSVQQTAERSFDRAWCCHDAGDGLSAADFSTFAASLTKDS